MTASVLCLLVGGSCADGTRTPERLIHTGSVYSFLEHLDDAVVEPSPIGRVESGVALVDGQERPAVLFQTPGNARFAGVRINPNARLRFGVGVGEDAACRPPDRVAFRVSVEPAPKAPALLWSATVGALSRWQDAEVDLSAYSGREVDVVLSADFTFASNTCAAAWSHPVVHASSVVVPAAALPIHRLTLVRDLLGKAAPPIDVGSFVGYGRLLQAPGVGATRRAAMEDRVARAGSMRFPVDVPAEAELELSGEVLHGTRAQATGSGSVGFDARVDGTLVLQRDVQSRAAPLTFSRRIPLGPLAGRKAVLELATRGTDSGSLGWWTSAWLLRNEELPRQVSQQGRNLLFVVVDTFRADRLGLYGARRDTSPNLDRLAGESLVFDQAIAPCSWTQPSVATLLTGRAPVDHGMIGGVPLDPTIETLAEVLQREGLTTFALSSNPIIGRREGFHRGFERFVQVPWARADHVNELFRDWLEDHRDTRWFAYLHYIDPHDSYDAPPPLGATFMSGLAPRHRPVPWELLHKANFSQAGAPVAGPDLDYLRAAYDGELRYWDAAFGGLVAMLGKAVLDNTVLIVVGDHGEEFMEHGKLFHGYHLYDESIRVPLLIRAPGLVRPGRERHVLELQRVTELATALAGGRPVTSDTFRTSPLAFSHTAMAAGPSRFKTLASVRDSDWKYVLDLDDDRAELFDLHRDPGERFNRTRDEPSVSSRYDALLRAWVASARPTGAAWRDPELVRRLRALGYIE